jgi:hypothetical protein
LKEQLSDHLKSPWKAHLYTSHLTGLEFSYFWCVMDKTSTLGRAQERKINKVHAVGASSNAGVVIWLNENIPTVVGRSNDAGTFVTYRTD